MVCDKSKRWGLEELKSHEFFHGINWKNLRKCRSPYVPDIRSPDDTSCFDHFEFDEDEKGKGGASNKGSKKSSKGKQRYCTNDIPFIGFTYKNYKAVR